jgi:hypothetical protein
MGRYEPQAFIEDFDLIKSKFIAAEVIDDVVCE